MYLRNPETIAFFIFRIKYLFYRYFLNFQVCFLHKYRITHVKRGGFTFRKCRTKLRLHSCVPLYSHSPHFLSPISFIPETIAPYRIRNFIRYSRISRRSQIHIISPAHNPSFSRNSRIIFLFPKLHSPNCQIHSFERFKQFYLAADIQFSKRWYFRKFYSQFYLKMNFLRENSS